MKTKLLLIGLLLAGAVIGALLGQTVEGTDALGWLAYAKNISLSPFTINLVIIKLTFGFDFSMNIAQVICTVIAIAVYPKLKNVIG